MHIEWSNDLLIVAITILLVLGTLLVVSRIRHDALKWTKLFLGCILIVLYFLGIIPLESAIAGNVLILASSTFVSFGLITNNKTESK